MEAKELTNKFSFQDLLGYFFPGLFGMFAIHLLLKHFDVQQTSEVSSNAFYSINYFVGCFILGIIFSGLSHPIVKIYYKLSKLDYPEKKLPDNISKQELEPIFNDVFGFSIQDKTWCSDYFYLCRNVVYEKMAITAGVIQRQGGLRLIRQYLLFPILIWATYFIFLVTPLKNKSICLWLGALLLVVIITLLLLNNLLNRMHKNRKREVDYVLLSIITLPKLKDL